MSDRHRCAPEQRTVEGRLQKIEDRKLMLPSFQRGLVWKQNRLKICFFEFNEISEGISGLIHSKI